MKIKLSAVKSSTKIPAFGFKPAKLRGFAELMALTQTHALSMQLYDPTPQPNREGKYPKAYRKQIDTIIGHGNILLIDIDEGNYKLKAVKKAMKSLNCGYMLTPSSGSTKKKRKYHISVIIKGCVPSHSDFKAHYYGLYWHLHKQGVIIDIAMSNSTQLFAGYKEGYGKKIIVEGKKLDFTKFKGARPIKTRDGVTTSKSDYVATELPKNTVLHADDAESIKLSDIKPFSYYTGHYHCPFNPKMHSDGIAKGRAWIYEGTLFCRCGCYATIKSDIKPPKIRYGTLAELIK